MFWDLDSSFAMKLIDFFLPVYRQKFALFIKKGVPRHFAVTVFNYEMFKLDSHGLKS